MLKLTTLAALLLLQAGCASAQVVAKNEGTSKISLALCFFESPNGWVSKGWFQVDPGTEKAIFPLTQGHQTLYYCATIEGCDQGYFGETSLMTHSSEAFTIPNADRNLQYADPRVKPYRYTKLDLRGKSYIPLKFEPANLTCYGKPQGKWRLQLDKLGDYAEKKEDAVMYREIDFDKGNPIGWSRDFYVSGVKRAEFKLVSAYPAVYDGKCTWYKEDGSIEREATYVRGSIIEERTVGQAGSALERKATYSVRQLPVQNFYLNSTSNEMVKGGRSRVTFPVNLPEGTVEWYYEFTASRDQATQAQNQQQFALYAQLSNIVDRTGLLAASVEAITAPPGANYCDVVLLDGANSPSFSANQQYRFFPTGSRKNYKSGIVQVKGLTVSNPTIGVANNNGLYGINVSVQVVAIVSSIN